MDITPSTQNCNACLSARQMTACLLARQIITQSVYKI